MQASAPGTVEEEGNSGGWWTGEPATFLGHLPEIGTLTGRTPAARAGLAPFNDDGGPRKGQRHIAGGRASVRCALYPSTSLRAFGLAAFNALRGNRILQAFYERLRAVGKPCKAALIATARKLLTTLNTLLQNPPLIPCSCTPLPPGRTLFSSRSGGSARGLASLISAAPPADSSRL